MSILEKARSIHEDVELIEDAAARLLITQRLLATSVDHGIDFLAREVMARSRNLLEVHCGSDSHLLEGYHDAGTGTHTDIWHEFYSRVKSAKETARQSDQRGHVCKLTYLMVLILFLGD